MFSPGGNYKNDFAELFKNVLGTDHYIGSSEALKHLELDLKGMNRAINDLLEESLGLEKSYNMYIEIYFKNGKERELLSVERVRWSDIIAVLESWVNDPEKCDFADDINYICIKANEIKYYQVNTIIKNLTRKVTLIRMKDRPNEEKTI